MILLPVGEAVVIRGHGIDRPHHINQSFYPSAACSGPDGTEQSLAHLPQFLINSLSDTTAPQLSLPAFCASLLAFLKLRSRPSILPCCMVVDDGTKIPLLLLLDAFSLDRTH